MTILLFPQSVVLSTGLKIKFGYFPVTNPSAKPQSIDTIDGVSSESGSIILGSVTGMISPIYILTSAGVTLNFGGPIFGTVIKIGRVSIA